MAELKNGRRNRLGVPFNHGSISKSVISLANESAKIVHFDKIDPTEVLQLDELPLSC